MIDNSAFNQKFKPARSALIGVLGATMFCGCAPLPPMPFDLVDKVQVFHGTMSQSDQRLEANIGGKRFLGYYLLATGTGYSQGGSWRRPYLNDMRTSFVSNSARATMVADDGERFVCEFIVEDNSAIGECKSTSGQTFQLVTQPR
ncbi:MAG: hypothetical protein WCV99_18435 [Sterolibacterium sp.]|jgi:hypothetical protein